MSRKLLYFVGFIAAVSATPAPQITPPPTLSPRAPAFTGFSLPPIPTVSIPPVSISIEPFKASSLSLNLPTPTCVRTITPDKNGYLPPGTCEALYNYYPSFTAAVIMSAVFGLLSIAHIVQAAVTKTGFCWVIIMGAIWEFGGYLFRSIGSKNQQSSGLATVSQLLILLGPLCKFTP
jgi:hypothetical protein